MSHASYALLGWISAGIILNACESQGQRAAVNPEETVQPAQAIPVLIGDGQIDGSSLRPYEFTWAQCNRGDNGWTKGAPFTESLSTGESTTLALTQSTSDAVGTQSTTVYTLDKASLARLSQSREITDKDGNLVATTATEFGPDGHVTEINTQGKTMSRDGKIGSNLFSGMFLGLPLSQLDYGQGEYELDAAMMSFKGTYKVWAKSAGQDYIDVGGTQILTERVDVKWLHHESGDIYPPGPDASGGRYWIIKNPPDAAPYVIAYKTDTYAIEYVPLFCGDLE